MNQQNYPGPGAPMPPMPPMGPHPGNGPATGSMVVGIISLVMVFFPFANILSVILGIIGIALAMQARNRGYIGGKATAGLVMSIIGLVLGGLFFAVCMCTACAVAPFTWMW